MVIPEKMDQSTNAMLLPPIFKTLLPTLVAGHSQPMNLQTAPSQTPLLWKKFRTACKAITQRTSEHYYSITTYPVDYFKVFDPTRSYTKWAAIEVTTLEPLPVGLDTLLLQEGQYAVFQYKGVASPVPFQYIYQTWLPESGYRLADRPHFEVLGPDYAPHDPKAEEAIWIPVEEA